MTALDIQEAYLEAARKYVDDTLGDDADDQTVDVLERWASVLDRLRRDPFECRRELDWVAKLALLESYRDRDGLAWDDPKLALIDLQYSDLRPEKGLYARLLARGQIDRLLDDAEVEAAVGVPAGGHPGVLPRPLPGAVRRAHRGRVVGLGDLRPAGSRLPAAHPDHGAEPRHPGARRRPARPVQDGGGALRRADVVRSAMPDRSPLRPELPEHRFGPDFMSVWPVAGRVSSMAMGRVAMMRTAT